MECMCNVEECQPGFLSVGGGAGVQPNLPDAATDGA